MNSWKNLYLFFLFDFFTLGQLSSFSYYPSIGMHYRFQTTRMTFMDAQKECYKKNSTLAMPKNRVEVEILRSHITPKYSFGVLLGFHSLYGVCDYVSMDGNSLQYYYHTWEDKEPSDSTKKRCVAVNAQGKLKNVLCNEKMYFFCEKGESINIYLHNKDRDCSSKDIGYSYSSKLRKCYKVHTSPRTWASARAICKAEGSNLADIRSIEEQEYLTMLVNDPENSDPCGTSQYVLIGTDAMVYNKVNSSLSGFSEAIGEAIHQCKGLNKNNGTIEDVGCNTESSFVCEQQKNSQTYDRPVRVSNFQISNVEQMYVYDKH